MKKSLLFILCAVSFAILSSVQAFAGNAPADSMNTVQLEAALKDKSKTEVKEIFGRAPDQAAGGMWMYSGQWLDPDAEKVMQICAISIFNDEVSVVVFQ